MAKQVGILPLIGTIGGVNFYYLNGKPVARRAGGGFNGKAIKSKRSMQRVRENSHEFGACSRVNKAFREALRPFYKKHRFTHLHSRLMGLFSALKNLDLVSKRGERLVANGVAGADGLAILQRFSYTPDCQVKTVLPFDYVVDSVSYALTISDFDINRVDFINGATHIELTYGVLDFNFSTLDYELHLASALVLDTDFAGASVSLVPDTLPLGIGTELCVFGVRFYQEVDGALYLLNAKDAVGFMVL
jgi:hypothetical protein